MSSSYENGISDTGQAVSSLLSSLVDSIHSSECHQNGESVDGITICLGGGGLAWFIPKSVYSFVQMH